MTFEEDVRNMKGRIREAIYEGKRITFYIDFIVFYRLRTGVRCSSTYSFLSYKSGCCFHVYFKPNMSSLTKGQLLNELKNYIKENGGCFYDV